jgi:hypothetical protein
LWRKIVIENGEKEGTNNDEDALKVDEAKVGESKQIDFVK